MLKNTKDNTENLFPTFLAGKLLHIRGFVIFFLEAKAFFIMLEGF